MRHFPRSWASTMFTPQPTCARSLASLETRTGPMPPSNQSAFGLDPLDREKVLDPVLLGNIVRVEARRLLQLQVQQMAKAIGLRKLVGGVSPALGGLLPLLVRDVTMLVQPRGELLRHRSGRAQQFFAGHHLPDHEEPEELAQVADDLVRAVELRERLLVAVVERLAPALLLDLVERVVGVAVQRAAKEEDDLVVVPHRLRRETLALLLEERLERLVDRDGRPHGEILPGPAAARYGCRRSPAAESGTSDRTIAPAGASPAVDVVEEPKRNTHLKARSGKRGWARLSLRLLAGGRVAGLFASWHTTSALQRRRVRRWFRPWEV